MANKYNLPDAEICIRSPYKEDWFQLSNYENYEDFARAYLKLCPSDSSNLLFTVVDHNEIPPAYTDIWSIQYLFPLIKIAKSISCPEEREAFGIWVDMQENKLFPSNPDDEVDEYQITNQFWNEWQGNYDTLERFFIDYLNHTNYFGCIQDPYKRHEIQQYFDHEAYARDKELNREVHFVYNHVYLKK